MEMQMAGKQAMHIFEEKESNVRSYCRVFQNVFSTAKGSKVYDETGKEYIDFFAGAGSLNYGHNDDYIKNKLLNYLNNDGIGQCLDIYTSAKREFIDKFYESILRPRNLDYKIQFCGPTGADAVEAALKLARKVKKRSEIFSFTGSYHGMTLGGISVTSSVKCQQSAGISLPGVSFMPYPYGFMDSFDTISYIEAFLTDDHSGVMKPAAIIFETTQGEGGVIVSQSSWLIRLAELCKKHDILMICDDIQVGCGRTGTFFSFERAGIQPDIVILSKSISGYGLPMAIILFKPELDLWSPGEHAGTFRGNQLAFMGGQAALELREKLNLDEKVEKKEAFIRYFLENKISNMHRDISIRGIGMIWGIDLSLIGGSCFARQVSEKCFQNGLIIECAGRKDSVLKLLPPLNIPMEDLSEGCLIIKNSLGEMLDHIS
jgi:diaminobutyrate-2-oxoglutarate transaminase